MLEQMMSSAPQGVRRCRVCGCSDCDACWDAERGACWWVERDLCSHCSADSFDTAVLADGTRTRALEALEEA